MKYTGEETTIERAGTGIEDGNHGFGIGGTQEV